MLIDLKSHEGFRNPHTKFHLNQTIASAIFKNFYFNYILKVKHFYTISTQSKKNGGHNCKSDLESMTGQTCSFNLPFESSATKAQPPTKIPFPMPLVHVRLVALSNYTMPNIVDTSFCECRGVD